MEDYAESVDAFIGRHSPARQWLIEGLLPVGAKVMMSGKPGAGKSWVAEHMAICLATGQDFASHFPVPKPVRVLLVDEDTSGPLLADRLRLLRGGSPSPANLTVTSQKGVRLDDSTGELQGLVERVRPDVIILDTFRALAPDMNEDSSKGVTGPLAALDALQRLNPCTILLLHHERKSSTGSSLDDLRGSTAIPSKMDDVIFIGRWSFGDGQTGMSVRSDGKRYRTTRPFLVRLHEASPVGTGISVVYEGPLKSRDEEDVDIVLRLVADLSSSSDGATIKAMHEATGEMFGTARLREICRKLEAEGRTVRATSAHGRHVYRPTAKKS